MDHIGEVNEMVVGTTAYTLSRSDEALVEARRLVVAGLILRNRMRRVLREMKAHECRSPCPWCAVEGELRAMMDSGLTAVR